MDQFVCVRLVKANAMDLALFQFDYDLTFAVVFMHADGAIYGRFGSRSERHDAEKDISLEGFSAALDGVLALHKSYPANERFLTGKQPQPTEYKTPDDYPSLRGKYKTLLDYEGQVTQSCMHCHQVLDAEREIFRKARKPIPDKLLFPHPMPNVIGLSMDPKERAKVAAVEARSAAAAAGLQRGDEILTLNGQAIVSTADIQWVLHTADESDQIEALLRRGDEKKQLTITLDKGWRQRTDIAWRVSSWELRRMGTGGLLLEALPAAERRKHNIDNDSMALLVKHVGQYGPHAAAKNAGFQQGDILVSFNNQTNLTTDSALLAYAAQNTKPGDRVPVSVLRNGKRVSLQLPMQE